MDKYDEQIEKLTQNPKQIDGDWNHAIGLFAFVRPGKLTDKAAEYKCGCLTMIRGAGYKALDENGVNEQLTAEIRADAELPLSAEEITAANLPRFAYWQRRLDRELRKLDK